MTQEPKALAFKELFDLKNKTAIVTGGAAGIGFSSAQRLAEAGASVVIADLVPDIGQKKTQELTDSGFKAAFVKCDVTQEPEVANMVDFAVKTFGGLDIIVNNAGAYPNRPFTEMDADFWDKVMTLNMKGVYLCCYHATKQMIKQGKGGNIINITSASASHPTAGLSAYDSSKSGIWMFTRTLATEMAPHKIWVNSVSPGPIHTEGTSSPEDVAFNQSRLHRLLMHRIGRPDEIANVVLFLASPASSFITGGDISAEGGWTFT